VDLAGSDNLVDERVDRGAPAIDDALSADLDHGGIRQDPEVSRRVHRSHKLWIGQRTLHQERFELRGRVCHQGTSFRSPKRSSTARELQQLSTDVDLRPAYQGRGSLFKVRDFQKTIKIRNAVIGL